MVPLVPKDEENDEEREEVEEDDLELVLSISHDFEELLLGVEIGVNHHLLLLSVELQTDGVLVLVLVEENVEDDLDFLVELGEEEDQYHNVEFKQLVQQKPLVDENGRLSEELIVQQGSQFVQKLLKNVAHQKGGTQVKPHHREDVDAHEDGFLSQFAVLSGNGVENRVVEGHETENDYEDVADDVDDLATADGEQVCEKVEEADEEQDVSEEVLQLVEEDGVQEQLEEVAQIEGDDSANEDDQSDSSFLLAFQLEERNKESDRVASD